jgi:hypothetical protein
MFLSGVSNVGPGGSKFSVRPGPCTSERRLGASAAAVLKVFCDRAIFVCIISSSTAKAPRSALDSRRDFVQSSTGFHDRYYQLHALRRCRRDGRSHPPPS